jgi:hypothetical protein
MHIQTPPLKRIYGTRTRKGFDIIRTHQGQPGMPVKHFPYAARFSAGVFVVLSVLEYVLGTRGFTAALADQRTLPKTNKIGRTPQST